MKNAIALALVLASSSFASAADSVSLTDALVNPLVAPCMKKLYTLQKSYQLLSREVNTTQNDRDLTTTIRYLAIQGGDMVRGDVTLTINSTLVPQFGFPESTGTPVVQGCSVTKDIY